MDILDNRTVDICQYVYTRFRGIIILSIKNFAKSIFSMRIVLMLSTLTVHVIVSSTNRAQTI